MNLTTYYYELDRFNGTVLAKTDQEAIEKAKEKARYHKQELLCIYKESESPNGLPMIVIYDYIGA